MAERKFSMSNIIFKYDRKNVFGERDYSEDRGQDNLKNIKKAFRLFCNDRWSAIEIDNFRGYETAVFVWNNYDAGNIMICLYPGNNYNDEYIEINIFNLKKEVYSLYDKETGERKDP